MQFLTNHCFLRFTLAALFMAQFATDVFANEYTFAPESCEFNIAFPVKYNSKTLVKDGVEGLAATAKISNSISAQAECWSQNNDISISSYAKSIEVESKNRGILVDSVIIDNNTIKSVGTQVVLNGRISINNKYSFVKFISTFGKYSRLDLIVIDDELASSNYVKLRNSILKR